MKKRLDILLVEKAMVATRSRAQQLIREGKVLCNGELPQKCGELVDEDAVLMIEGEAGYVGRGYLKMQGALKSFSVNPADKVVADIGASTGGFTECLLKQGARLAYTLDVGRDQLAASLRSDPRVINREGINVKTPFQLPELVDLCVVDLSFISLTLVLDNLFPLMQEKGEMIVLYKPQFEVGARHLNKQGVVKSRKLIDESLRNFCYWCANKSWRPVDFAPSCLQGQDGNREFFFHLQKAEFSVTQQEGLLQKIALISLQSEETDV